MKQSTYNNFDDLPLFLNAETAAALLGVSISSMYELMHEKGFPVLRVGSRLVIPKDKLRYLMISMPLIGGLLLLIH